MALVVDGVEIPVEINYDEQGGKKAAAGMDALIDKGGKLSEQYDKRKDKIKQEAEAVKRAEEQKQRALELTTSEMRRQSAMMTKLSRVGALVAASGVAMVGGLIGAAKTYAEKAAETDEIAQKWKSSTERIESAHAKLGKSITEILNPAYEKLADILERVSSAISSDKIGASAALELGVSLLTGGTIMATLAKVSSILAGLGAATGSAQLGAAGAAIGSAAVPASIYALSIGIGAAIGKGIGNKINELIGQEEQTWGDILDTAKRVSAIFSPIGLAAQALEKAGLTEAASKLWEFAKLINGIKEPVASSATIAAQLPTPSTPVAETARDRAAKWQQEQQERQVRWDLEAAQRREQALQAQEQRARQILDAQKNLANQELAIRQRMAEATRSFLQSEQDAHQDYYNRRSDMARQAGIDAQRAEVDHQRRIRDILQRGNERVLQAAQQRDALGLVRAKREMEQERSNAEEQYQIEASRRNQDFAERIKQMDRDFAIQRERRLREYEFKMRAYEAEVSAAQSAYQAIVAAILQMRFALDNIAVGRVNSPSYAAVAGQSGGAGGQNATANININAGALNMTQVRRVAGETAAQVAAATLKAAFR